MTQFGYTVPTTWEDYQALSDKLAKDHPGYYLGTFGDGWSFLSFFEASNCPTHQLVDPTALNINVADPNCTRAASLVDHMIANKTLYNTDFFNTQFDALITANKVLMFEGPAWMWGSFGGAKGDWWTTANHQLGVPIYRDHCRAGTESRYSQPLCLEGKRTELPDSRSSLPAPKKQESCAAPHRRESGLT